MRSKPVRLLYVGNHAGHFLTHRLPVIQALKDIKGYEVHVAVPAASDELEKTMAADAITRITQLGFIHHPIPVYRKSMNVLNELRLMRRIYRLYAELQPDIMYNATIKPVIYGGIAARILRLSGMISLITGLGYVFITPGLKMRVVRTAIKQAYRIALQQRGMRVIFQNNDDRAIFIQQKIVAPEQAVIIKGAGVDVHVFQSAPEPEGPPIVVLPARMLWDKGVREFVEAAQRLKAAGIQTRFVLAGDIDPSNRASITREQLQQWHDSGAVEWWGWCDDIQSVMAGAHIICLPSYREGMPKALLEAAACGRPIVATDIAGCREVVRHEHNGLLVPPRDADALTEALRRLLQDRDLRQTMGARSRAVAEAEFSTDAIIRANIDLCEEILAQSENGRLVDDR